MPGKGIGKSKQNDSLANKMDRVLSRIPKGTFANLGTIAGGPAGGALGAAISTITGYGDYTVKTNSIATETYKGSVSIPTFEQGAAGARIRHREFIKDVIVPASSDFTNEVQLISPGNNGIFPWLSKVASQYQKYKVHGMVFYYKSTSTDYNNSGTVALSVNYNATENGYQTMQEVLNAMFAVGAKPSIDFAAPVECAQP